MIEHSTTHEDSRAYRLAKNRFVIMITCSILFAFVLVSIALALYGSSGAASVDLSRPGYSAVRDQAKEDTQDTKSFSSSGPIDKATIDEFDKLFSTTSKSATSVNAFDSELLSDEALRIVDTDSVNR